MGFNTVIPSEFRHIGHPFFLWSISKKFSFKNVLGNVLRTIGLPCASVVAVFNGGLDIQHSANAQHAFVVDFDVVVAIQIISDSAIAFRRIFSMDFLNDFRDLSVFFDAFAGIATQPLVVC
jgi:hypothetical protein